MRKWEREIESECERERDREKVKKGRQTTCVIFYDDILLLMIEAYERK